MGLPTVSDNLAGYEQAQLLNKAENIKSNSYYVIHGTLDDNVHYQQSMMLAKVLEQNDILFRQQVIIIIIITIIACISSFFFTFRHVSNYLFFFF